VLAEAEKTNAWNQDDRGIGVAQPGRTFVRITVVVFFIVSPILRDLLVDTRLKRDRVLALRVPCDEHRRNAGAKEMIRATRAQSTQLARPPGIGKCQRVFVISKVRNYAPV